MLFATGIALSVLLIAAYSRPFTSVGPELLKQVIASEAISGDDLALRLGVVGKDFFVHGLSPLAHNLTSAIRQQTSRLLNSVCDRVTDANSSGGDLRLLSG